MSELEAGSCVITQVEMMDHPMSSQLTYRLLKEKGAPIIGISVLLLDPRYSWFANEDPERLEVHFEWRPAE